MNCCLTSLNVLGFFQLTINSCLTALNVHEFLLFTMNSCLRGARLIHIHYHGRFISIGMVHFTAKMYAGSQVYKKASCILISLLNISLEHSS
jgi:hypothetical protein